MAAPTLIAWLGTGIAPAVLLAVGGGINAFPMKWADNKLGPVTVKAVIGYASILSAILLTVWK
ncbi:MAG: hypothetical protein HY376_03020 [Candidatus Blackburnbacteria bacterium]|nr:hypothetical protein [Candidatus Blackburnbacteria bacterium]